MVPLIPFDVDELRADIEAGRTIVVGVPLGGGSIGAGSTGEVGHRVTLGETWESTY